MNSGQTGVDYRILLAADADTGMVRQAGGLMQLTDVMEAGGARPVWLGYIGVDDVDATQDAVVEAGGSVHLPAWDIPRAGRMALVADPQGALFYLMRGAMQATSQAFAADRPRPGPCAWNELATTDPAAALAFYTRVSGWVKDGELDMGPRGAYEFLRHGPLIGAISPHLGGAPAPVWTSYFRVPSIQAAVERIHAGGGRLLHGPDEIPGGEFTLNGLDPHGAAFALVGGR